MNAAHASPCRLAACSLATLLLLAPLGCGSNTPIGRVSKSSQAMVNLLRPIKDASSATAAIPKIKPTFAEVAAANAAILQMMSDPAKVLSLMSQASNEMEEMSRTKDQMDAELERVDNLKGLPAEFWNVMRVESTRSLRDALAGIGDGGEMSASFQAMMVMYDQFGPQCVVELELRGVETGDKNAAIERLLKLAGPNATVAEVEDPEDSDIALLTVAPVDDFDKLAKGIDFGDVVDQEKAKGEIVVELPEAPAAEAAAADESDPAATDVAADPAAAPVDEYGNSLPSDTRGDYLGQESSPYGEFGAATEDQPTTLRGRLANAASSRFGNLAAGVSAVVAAERAAIEARATNGPQRGDRDYHAAMAAILYDPQSPHHQRAVTELLEVKPTDVADKKLRARIANGYRQLAFAENSTQGPQAIDGLVHWGGKFSAPLLIQLLEKQSGGNDEAIFTGLGKAATPEAADAIVKRLESNSGTGGEAAFAALEAMGPVAEPALIAALPFEQPDSNRAAIEILGEIGTRKSLSILRRAAKSENEDVKEAALASLRSIQERIRQEKPATPTSAPKKPAAGSTST